MRQATPSPQLLIVEDEADTALDLNRRLLGLGYDIVGVVSTDVEARHVVAKRSVDLILMDIRLQRAASRETTTETIEPPHTIPVIYLTTDTDETAVPAPAVAPYGYLIKPFSGPALQATVEMALVRRELEQRVLVSERFHKIFDEGPLGMATVDLEFRFCDVNSTLSKMLDYSAGELAGRPYRSIAHPEDCQFDLMMLAQVVAGELPQYQVERRYVRRDGQLIWGHLTATMIRDQSGQPHDGLLMIEDITRRRESEETVRIAQKIESLGLMAGGIAHDFNNSLVIMLGQTSLALSKLGADHPVATHLQEAIAAAENSAGLTQQLLAYSGHGVLQLQPVNINQVIGDNMAMLRTAVPDNITFTCQLDDAVPPVKGDGSQIHQMIVNLITNAVEAIGHQNGAIELKTTVTAVTSRDEHLWQYTGIPLIPGDYLTVTIQDNGSGMDSATQARIFDPFFSTKFTGRGLGLAAVLGILRGHLGGMSLDSRVGEGTRFTLYIPALPAHFSPAEAATLPVPSQTAGDEAPLILVIDDESGVATALSDILSSFDFRVLMATSGRSGVTLFTEHQADINLVLLDLSMPGMSGEETLQVLRALDPEVPVVLTTGFSRFEVAERLSGLEYTGFLQKPYRAHVLAEEVRRHLR